MEGGVPSLHPWSNDDSGDWDTPPDEEATRVFYEMAVKRMTRQMKAVRNENESPRGEMMGRRRSDAVGHRRSQGMGRVVSIRNCKEFKEAGSATVGAAIGRMLSRKRCPSGEQMEVDSQSAAFHMTPDHLHCIAEDLDFKDLGHDEIARIWETIPKDKDGRVGQEQFAAAVASGPGSPTLRLLVKKLRQGFDYGFAVPSTFDYSKSTSENYRVDGKEFADEFAHLRRELDYKYHSNYTMERQRWQDGAIKSAVVRSSQQPAPWLVFTCGPMGVGKGYCVSWMSKHGFFPLENIVHVDPDGFKMMMPEWSKYVKHSGDEAGTLCHQESALMMEIAQGAAIERRQNIWIDGSLRNAEFYASVFQNIRDRHPHYKISIMYIYADEAVIRQRVKIRAERTRRTVPEHLIQSSLGAMDQVLNRLTPLCDFVARINNSGEVPVLTAFETVDTKGSWSVLKDRFARLHDNMNEFPQFLAPLPLIQLPYKDVAILRRTAGSELEVQLDVSPDAPAIHEKLANLSLVGRVGSICDPVNSLAMKGKMKNTSRPTLTLMTSPMSQVTLENHDRILAGIPEGVDHYFWVFPLHQERQEVAFLSAQERADPLVHFLFQGGFCYCDAEQNVLSVHAISHKREDAFLQFDRPTALSRSVTDKIKKTGRFHPVMAPYLRQRGATKFCWVMPEEIFGKANVGGRNGAFVYLMEGQATSLLFPVLSV